MGCNDNITHARVLCLHNEIENRQCICPLEQVRLISRAHGSIIENPFHVVCCESYWMSAPNQRSNGRNVWCGRGGSTEWLNFAVNIRRWITSQPYFVIARRAH